MKKCNETQEAIFNLCKFNIALYEKLKEKGMNDNDYPFVKRMAVETIKKIDISNETIYHLKQL